MKNQTLNVAKHFYNRHFPEIPQVIPDPTTNEFTLPNPFNNSKKDFIIDDTGMFRSKNPNFNGFYTDFLKLAEGTPTEEDIKEIAQNKKGIYPPTLDQITLWHNDLFSVDGKALLNYLTNERGLTEESIKKYLLGYNAAENELVIPALNITRKNPISVKYIKLPIASQINEENIRVEGPSYLLGYHKLRFDKDALSIKYLVKNEIDGLFLRQQGLEVYCSLKTDCSLAEDWYELFEGCNVVAFTSHDDQSQLNVEKLANSKLKSIKIVDLPGEFITDFFIKEKKVLADLIKIIDNSQVLNDKFLESVKLLREFQENGERTEIINGAQDFTKIGFVYGGKIGDKYCFITSEKSFLEESKLIEKGINRRSEFTSQGITPELVKKYILENKSVLSAEVFDEIKAYIKKYIYFNDGSIYDLLTLWVMGTYVFRIFRHYPYIHLQAEKSSGKSQLMELLQPISFNGKLYLDPTGAVIFREADRNTPTMFIDESENLNKGKASEALLSLLNSGFQKGAKVTRTQSGGAVDYSVYCPKMFAGINDMNDVLQSRTIHIKMLRKLSEEKVERYTNDPATCSYQKKLVEDLCMFGLQYADTIKNIYENNIESIIQLNEFQNRQHDILTPLFIFASIIDKEKGNTTLSDSLLLYLKKQNEVQAEKDISENSTARILNKINEILPMITYTKKVEDGQQIILKYSTENVFNEFHNDSEWKREVGTKNKLTGLLKKVGIEVKTENVKGKSEKCYIIDVNNLYEFGKRYGVEITFKKQFSQKSKPSKIYIPNRVIITNDSKNSPTTQDILQRIKQLNPNLKIEYSNDERPSFPPSVIPSDENDYLQETIVLATRKSPFIFTFPSPGNIVEGMTTILQMSYFCNSNCTFCYLQTAGQNPIRWRKLYTNLDEMERQIEKEPLVHNAALTLWSAISFYEEKALPKIPLGFNDLIDDIRKEFFSSNSKIENDSDVKKYLTDTLADKLLRLGLKTDYKKLEPIKKDISLYYRENQKNKLYFNVSEFSDIVKADHISNYLEYLMKLVQKNKEFRFKFHTQSTNLESLLKYPADNRVEVTMDFNTDYVIDKYCAGTSSLDERIDAAKKILAKGDIGLKISIEPIITYAGYENDYLELVDRIMSNLNLSSKSVKSIKIGCVRIAPTLRTMIKSNFPDTEMISGASVLEQPIAPDPKHRYEFKVRKNIYKALLDKLSVYHNKTYISCETPDLWKELGLDYAQHLKNSVYQYS